MKPALEPYLRDSGEGGVELVIPTGVGGCVVHPLRPSSVFAMARVATAHVNRSYQKALALEIANGNATKTI